MTSARYAVRLAPSADAQFAALTPSDRPPILDALRGLSLRATPMEVEDEIRSGRVSRGDVPEIVRLRDRNLPHPLYYTPADRYGLFYTIHEGTVAVLAIEPRPDLAVTP